MLLMHFLLFSWSSGDEPPSPVKPIIILVIICAAQASSLTIDRWIASFYFFPISQRGETCRLPLNITNDYVVLKRFSFCFLFFFRERRNCNFIPELHFRDNNIPLVWSNHGNRCRFFFSYREIYFRKIMSLVNSMNSQWQKYPNAIDR
jgi:hypothetical protein